MPPPARVLQPASGVGRGTSKPPHSQRGLSKVGGGPATVLPPRLPPHGLPRLLSPFRVRLAHKCSTGPLCCSLSARGSGKRRGHFGSGL